MPAAASQRRNVVEEDDDLSEIEARTDDSSSETDRNDDTSINEKVKALVRLALAAEYQRQPLRRNDIRTKVLGTATRSFKKVFDQAQDELRSVFGMELVELPPKELVTMAEKKAAQQRTNSSDAARSYVLTSMLPSVYHDPDIIAPVSASESTFTAVYTMIVSLIYLSHGRLDDSKLDRYLRRLGIEDNTPVIGMERTTDLKKQLEKRGYIREIKETIGNGGEVDISWIVGPRGKVEVNQAGVKGLVEMMYDHPEGDEGLELQKRLVRSLGLNDKPPAPKPQKRKRNANTQRSEREASSDSSEDE